MNHVEMTLSPLSTFEALRGRLFGLSYRMLGSRADAEDVVQEAYVRWHQAEHGDIRSAEAWLVTTTTRLAVDRLRSAQATREQYVGPWLPEPIVQDASSDPDHRLEADSDLSLAFLVLLERLAPEERAAFLLHDVFDVGYPLIAETLGKSEVACRQLVTRARRRVRDERRRQADVSAEAKAALVRAFVEAGEARDEQTLLRLFAPDAVWMADGGGVVHAAPRPLHGAPQLVRLVLGLQRIYARHDVPYEWVLVNGEPGLVRRHDGQVRAVYAFDIRDGRIASVYIVLNPEKLVRC